jgi:hypothetical protein
MVPRAQGNGSIRYGRAIRTDYDEFVAKADHHLTSRQRISFRHVANQFDDASAWDGRNLLTLNDSSAIRSQNAVLSHSGVLSATLINDARFTFARVASLRDMPEGAPRVTDFGVDVWQPGGQPGIELSSSRR